MSPPGTGRPAQREVGSRCADILARSLGVRGPGEIENPSQARLIKRLPETCNNWVDIARRASEQDGVCHGGGTVGVARVGSRPVGRAGLVYGQGRVRRCWRSSRNPAVRDVVPLLLTQQFAPPGGAHTIAPSTATALWPSQTFAPPPAVLRACTGVRPPTSVTQVSAAVAIASRRKGQSDCLPDPTAGPPPSAPAPHRRGAPPQSPDPPGSRPHSTAGGHPAHRRRGRRLVAVDRAALDDGVAVASAYSTRAALNVRAHSEAREKEARDMKICRGCRGTVAVSRRCPTAPSVPSVDENTAPALT